MYFNPQRRQTMSNVIKASQDLLEFIDIHDVADETAYDSGGQSYEIRSKHFSYLIDKAREELKKLTQLPYPVTNTFNKKNEGLVIDGAVFTMSSLSYSILEKESATLLGEGIDVDGIDFIDVRYQKKS
jgi:hypothetical protein